MQDTVSSSRSKQSLRAWLRLLGTTSHIEKILQQKFRSEFSSTLPRFAILAELSRRAEGMTMSELSSMLLVSNGNVTGLAKRLQEDGLVLRAPMPTDKRTYRLYITSKGKKLFSSMAEQHETWIRQLFENLDAAEIATLMAVLAKMNPKNIREEEKLPEDER